MGPALSLQSPCFFYSSFFRLPNGSSESTIVQEGSNAGLKLTHNGKKGSLNGSSVGATQQSRKLVLARPEHQLSTMTTDTLAVNKTPGRVQGLVGLWDVFFQHGLDGLGGRGCGGGGGVGGGPYKHHCYGLLRIR